MLRAIGGELTSFGTLVKMPVLADDIVAPLATTSRRRELTQLAWVNYRAGQTLRCRLGGTPTSIGGESALVPVEENRNVVLMFLGVSAPQPPPPQYGLFGPGCVVHGTRRPSPSSAQQVSRARLVPSPLSFAVLRERP